MLSAPVTYLVSLSIVFSMAVLEHAYADTIDTSGQEAYEQCGYCHEYDGNSRMQQFPKLAGQQAAYLYKQLHDFKSGQRLGTMQATAELLSNKDIDEVVEYFSQQTLQTTSLTPQLEKDKQRGRQLYSRGDPEVGLPACASCHGDRGLGKSTIPRLSGQHEDYLKDQLIAFKNAQRDNDKHGQMRSIGSRLTIGDIRSLAGYLARLPAAAEVSSNSSQPALSIEINP